MVRHFFLDFFQVEFGTGESRLGMAPLLAVLMVPGALMSIALFAKYSALLRWIKRDFTFNPDIASLPDKYMFIAMSIAVTGIVAVLRWDSLFPDRRDFANLAPLPIETRGILLAKLTALTGFVLIFVIDVNLLPTILFPMIVMENQGTFHDLLAFWIAHAVAVTAAGLWTFCAFLAVTGTLMAVLPYGVFRRSRRYFQFLCIVLLLILFLSAPAMRFEVVKIRSGVSSPMEWLPVAWFLGLYQTLQGKAAGSFPALSAMSIRAMAMSVVLALAAYGISYRWYFLRSAETTEGPSSGWRLPPSLFRWVDALLLRSSFDRATFRFIVRTLARSEQHTAMLAATLGTGFALAVQSAMDARPGDPVPSGLLASSLIVVYSLLAGLRLSFGLPSEVRANWTFRMASDEGVDPQRVVRIAMFLFLLPVAALSSLVCGIAFWPEIGAGHMIFTLCCAAVLIELLTAGFRVIPFTCSWIPGRENLVFAIAVWAAGLLFFGPLLAIIEGFLLLDFWRFLPFLVVIAAILFAQRYLRKVREPIAWSDTRGEFDLLRIGE
ncbi:MAG: hypothetical protein H7Y20_06820 [Bryobacteraceae bacterium]|nr:hypothetical protein [Bryobacteraceae bacterium]